MGGALSDGPTVGGAGGGIGVGVGVGGAPQVAWEDGACCFSCSVVTSMPP